MMVVCGGTIMPCGVGELISSPVSASVRGRVDRTTSGNGVTMIWPVVMAVRGCVDDTTLSAHRAGASATIKKTARTKKCFIGFKCTELDG